MKTKIITLIIVFASCLANGQKLPILNLSDPTNIDAYIKSPLELKQDEICVTLITSNGLNAYSHYTHYVFTVDGDVKAFKEEIPSPYIKNGNLKKTTEVLNLQQETKSKLKNNINSTSTLEFIKFSQNDFLKPVKTKFIQPPCVIDATGYSISFIQNNKQKVYSFYAPEYYINGKCKNERLNKKVLQKYVELLKRWEVI